MPEQIWNVEFLNQNSQRSFPLSEEATKRDVTDTIAIPDSFIVNMYMPVHAGLDVEPDKFFLRELGLFATGFTIIIAYDDGTGLFPPAAAAQIPRVIHVENRSYAMPGIDDFDDTAGKIVIGKLDEIDSLPLGVFKFDPAGGKLDSDVIRPMIRGIQSLTLVNGQDRSEPIVGDIELIAGQNMRLVPILTAGENPRVVFNAIEGEGLTEDCVCEEDTESPPIRTINGIPPDISGNFTLLGNDCLEVTPVDNGLRLQDVCSAPCCGCEELEAVNRQIARFGDGVVTLQTFVTRLATEVTTMTLNVLGSRISDKGCFEC